MQIFRLFNPALHMLAAALSLSLVACKDVASESREVTSSQNLRFIAAYPLEIAEPSGLSLAKNKQSLWTVSDRDGGIYQISLQGKVLSHFDSGHRDLEAITTIDSEQLAFTSERERKIVIARKDGTVVDSAPIGIPGSDNKGPEALTYDEDAEQFYVMQENPGILLTLNRDLEEIERRELKFAQDYSSISFDSGRKEFWVLSDRSNSIHVLDQSLRIQQSFSVNVEQMEGIAVDHHTRLVYLISDPLEMLYVFEFDAL